MVELGFGPKNRVKVAENKGVRVGTKKKEKKKAVMRIIFLFSLLYHDSQNQNQWSLLKKLNQ